MHLLLQAMDYSIPFSTAFESTRSNLILEPHPCGSLSRYHFWTKHSTSQGSVRKTHHSGDFNQKTLNSGDWGLTQLLTGLQEQKSGEAVLALGESGSSGITGKWP